MSTIQTCVAIVVLHCTDTLWIHDTHVQKCGLMTGSYDRSSRRRALIHCVLLVEIWVTNTFTHLTVQEFLGAVDDWEQTSMSLILSQCHQNDKYTSSHFYSNKWWITNPNLCECLVDINVCAENIPSHKLQTSRFSTQSETKRNVGHSTTLLFKSYIQPPTCLVDIHVCADTKKKENVGSFNQLTLHQEKSISFFLLIGYVHFSSHHNARISEYNPWIEIH